MQFIRKLKILNHNTLVNGLPYEQMAQFDQGALNIEFSYENNIPFSLVINSALPEELYKKIKEKNPNDRDFDIWTNIIYAVIDLTYIYTMISNKKTPMVPNIPVINVAYSKMIEGMLIMSYTKSTLALQKSIQNLTQFISEDEEHFIILRDEIDKVNENFIEINKFIMTYVQRETEKDQMFSLRLTMGESLTNAVLLHDTHQKITKKINQNTEENIYNTELLRKDMDDKLKEIETVQHQTEKTISSNDSKTLTIMSLFLAVVALLMSVKVDNIESWTIFLVMVFITLLFTIIRITDTFLNTPHVKNKLSKIIITMNWIMFIILALATIFIFANIQQFLVL